MLATDQRLGVGRRKSAVSTVFLKQGGEGFTINNCPIEVYFTRPIDRFKIAQPFQVAGLSWKDFSIAVNARGGGITGQAEATALAIARILAEEKESANRSKLKKAGLLRRDARAVERKKVGQPKARKKKQYSKR